MDSSASAIAFSPSFNSYSSGTLADIAARVIEEYRAESVVISSNDYYDDGMFNFTTPKQEDQVHESLILTDKKLLKQGNDADADDDDADDDDDEFEFAFVCRDPDSSPISADEIFYNGQIKPVFPLFDTSLLLEDGADIVAGSKPPPVRLSLRKLFIEERDSPSCSSSEADELDGASPETYCVWRPKTTPEEDSPGRCKKSQSTGNSSKRWKFKDLLHRSLSDGRDTFIFLTPSGSTKRSGKVEKPAKVGEKSNAGGVGHGVSVTEGRKSMNRANAKESERRRSYLPYKSDLVGLFANVNELSRNIHPF